MSKPVKRMTVLLHYTVEHDGRVKLWASRRGRHFRPILAKNLDAAVGIFVGNAFATDCDEITITGIVAGQDA